MRSEKHFSIDDFFGDPALPIAVHRRPEQRPKELHTHAFSELVIVLGGQAIHFTEGDEHTIRSGDVFVIQGKLAHGYRNAHTLSLINIMYDPDRLNLPAADLRSIPGYHALFTLEPQYRRLHQFASRLQLGAANLEAAVHTAAQLETEAGSRCPGYVFMATALFMQLITFLARCYKRDEATPENKILLRIGAAISHLEDHYRENVSIPQLIQIAGMSESSLARAFKRATGRTPIDYLLHLRLLHARDLLRNTDLNITEIAFETGFNDSNYLTRQFRKQTGCAPRDYRHLQNGVRRF